MSIREILPTLVITLMLTACVGNSPMEDKPPQSVAVSKQVMFLSEASIVDHHDIGYLFFPGLSKSERDVQEDAEFEQLVSTLKTQIAEALTGEFIARLRSNPAYEVSDRTETTPVFEISIIGLGLVKKTTFSRFYKQQHLTFVLQILLQDTILMYQEQDHSFPLLD